MGVGLGVYGYGPVLVWDVGVREFRSRLVPSLAFGVCLLSPVLLV